MKVGTLIGTVVATVVALCWRYTVYVAFPAALYSTAVTLGTAVVFATPLLIGWWDRAKRVGWRVYIPSLVLRSLGPALVIEIVHAGLVAIRVPFLPSSLLMGVLVGVAWWILDPPAVVASQEDRVTGATHP
ncbi:hypothetical protein [Dyella psychrodurans]|uniref:Uncharacterized protein n=1 Tax=Dyella psychrodurans TaxID=1927960 RepID=A0A370XC71_9GAMM|nr:hypothetical protein [Dyella psychrodurans]RDS85902.1 hypothetical protein DWU99_01090 [Dyella psychrodurans]